MTFIWIIHILFWGRRGYRGYVGYFGNCYKIHEIRKKNVLLLFQTAFFQKIDEKNKKYKINHLKSFYEIKGIEY